MAEVAGNTLPLAILEKHQMIEVADIFIWLSQADHFFRKLVFYFDVKLEDLEEIVRWEDASRKRREDLKFNPDKLKLTGGIGKDWAAGYTLALSRCAYDLSPAVINFPWRYNSHAALMQEMEKALVKSAGHNILLVGEPGVGKKTLVYFLTQKIGRVR